MLTQSANPAALQSRVVKRQGKTRQRILNESAKLFVGKGFENVSVEEIIDASDIARSSFYRYFSNREEVLANIIRPVFEHGVACLEELEGEEGLSALDGILNTYLALWQAGPDALKVSMRVGGVHFFLFEDVHRRYREILLDRLKRVEQAGVLLNDSADLSGRLIARTAIPMLEIYCGETQFENLFINSMRGMLLKKEYTS